MSRLLIAALLALATVSVTRPSDAGTALPGEIGGPIPTVGVVKSVTPWPAPPPPAPKATAVVPNMPVMYRDPATGRILSIENQLPPAEFDHLFAGNVDIVRIPTVEQTGAECGYGRPVLGCTRRPGTGYVAADRCIILVASDKALAPYHMSFEIVLRHEMGHCNGWDAQHTGARTYYPDSQANGDAKK